MQKKRKKRIVAVNPGIHKQSFVRVLGADADDYVKGMMRHVGFSEEQIDDMLSRRIAN